MLMSTIKDRLKEHEINNSIPRKAKVYFDFVQALGEGDFIKGARAYSDLRKRTTDPRGVIDMRRRNYRRKAKPKRRLRKVPENLRAIRLPQKRVVMYESTKGTEHRWYYQVKLSLLTASLRETFAEFKVVNLSVKYVPNNSLSETGLYVSVLLDREGFGGYGSATGVSWFSYLGSMPGSVIKPRHTSTLHRWKPTEPSVRDWRNKDEDTVLATCYICNNGKETDELGGLFEIRALVLARGRFYNAAISHLPPPHAFPLHSGTSGVVENSAAQDQVDRASSPMSSVSSVVGGFVNLGT